MSTLQWQTPELTEITPRALTDDEVRVDIAAKLEAMHAAWAASEGIERRRQLTSALIMCGPFRPLPDWLYKALLDQQMAALQQWQPDIHWQRYWMVTGAYEAAQLNGQAISLRQAARKVSKVLDRPFDTIWNSYKKIMGEIGKVQLGSK